MTGHREMDRFLASDPDDPQLPLMVTNKNAITCECRYGGDRCLWPAEYDDPDTEVLMVCEWCQIGLCHEEPHGFHG